MTRVCLVGKEDATLPEDLLSFPTARDALDSYRLEEPYENAVAVETISIGAAVSLLNDLDWYLVRLVSEALVLEPSVSEDEWLSRKLATTVRNETVEPEDTGTFLKIYGVVPSDAGEDAETGDGLGDPVDGEADQPAEETADDAKPPAAARRPRLAEPLYAQRVDGEVPAYDLREVEDTLVVRVTAEEFGA